MPRRTPPATPKLDTSLPAYDARLSYGYADGPVSGQYDWHSHPHHQLIYTFSGSVTIEADGRSYLLPPQRAVWIAAGTKHRTTALRATTGSVFLAAGLIAHEVPAVQVIAASPLLIEMIRHATTSWPYGSAAQPTARRQRYFSAFADLLDGWFESPILLSLPTTDDPQIAAAVNDARLDLAHASIERAADAAGMSTRTFRRKFKAEMGLHWRAYLTRARLLAAMDRLLSHPSEPITGIALTVGFASASAFSEAFREFASMTPSSYRRSGLGEAALGAELRSAGA